MGYRIRGAGETKHVGHQKKPMDGRNAFFIDPFVF